MDKRVGRFDIAKAIAWCFIVAGHLGLTFSSATVAGGMPPAFDRFAFTFHLPVFLVISGYFFPFDQGLSPRMLIRNAKALLAPYAASCIIIIVSCALAGQLRDGSGIAEIVRWGQASLWGAGATSGGALWQVERIGGIWFLPALFFARIIIASTRRFSESARACIMVCLLAIAVVSARRVWLPLSIQSGMGICIYLYIGMLARRHRLFDTGRLPRWAWLACAVLWAACIWKGGLASIAMCVYPLGLLDVLGGIAACFIIVALSGALEHGPAPVVRGLELVGRNTLPLFALHICEDNIINWGLVGIWMSGVLGGAWYAWIILLVIRLCLDIALAGAAYLIPGLDRIFYQDKYRLAPRPSDRQR